MKMLQFSTSAFFRVPISFLDVATCVPGDAEKEKISTLPLLFMSTKRKTKMKASVIVTAVAISMYRIEEATAFTVPYSSVTRAIVGNNVRVYPKSAISRKSLRRNVATGIDSEVAAEPDVPKEPLFEAFEKGVLRDYKARLPYMKSDIKDGLNIQVSNCAIVVLSVGFNFELL